MRVCVIVRLFLFPLFNLFSLSLSPQSDVFVVVVGEVNVKEQSEMYLLSKEIKNCSKSSKKILVVHNLRDVETDDEFNEKVEKIKSLYKSLEVQRQEVPIGGRNVVVEYLDGVKTPQGRREQADGLERQMHFWIAMVEKEL